MRMPDFLVIGAQKSATTDLCWNLAQQPGCFFASPKELNFFCCDDADVHPYPLFEAVEDWIGFDWDTERDLLLRRYSEAFSGASETEIAGEGTPVYLYSARALTRIRECLPTAKIVVILRDPVDRAWSAYWHHVRIGRATLPFPEHLLRETSNTLRFGRYLEALAPWYEAFGPEKILPLTFEGYVRDRRAHLERVCAHIGLKFSAPPGQKPKNAGDVPLSLTAQLAANRLAVRLGATSRTIEHLAPPAPRHPSELVVSHLVRGFKRANQLAGKVRGRSKPSMPRATREMLVAYYQRENAGLGRLTGLDLERDWASFR